MLAIKPYVHSRVPVDALSEHGTAFSIAIMVGLFEIATALLDLGADPLIRPGDSEDWRYVDRSLSALR